MLSLSTIIVIICLILCSNAEGNEGNTKNDATPPPKPIVMRDNNLGKREELTCHEQKTGCALICLPLRCRNIHFKAAIKKKTTIRCDEKLSCIGELQIEGHELGHTHLSKISFMSSKFKVHRPSSLGIECLAAHACHGGTYAFARAANAKFIGHAKESSIIFNEIETAEILVASNQLEGIFDSTEQFVMNHVYTHEVNEIVIEANADHSMIGSVFHLGGLIVAKPTNKNDYKNTGRATIKCLQPGACDGSIFLFKECGGDIEVVCAKGACQFMSIVFRPVQPPHEDDCLNYGRHRYLNILLSDVGKEYTPEMFIWNPIQYSQQKGKQKKVIIKVNYPKKAKETQKLKEHLPNYVEYLTEGPLKRDQLTGSIIECATGDLFSSALKQSEKRLGDMWKETKELVKDNRKWILQEANVEYHGGIYAECAWSMSDYMKENVGWILGPMAASAVAGAQLSISMAILGGFFPVTIAGVAAATVWGFRRRAEKKHNEKFAIKNKGILTDVRDAMNMKQNALNDDGSDKISEAHEEMENMFGRDFVDDFLDFNGDIIEYDFFSGQRLFDDDDDDEEEEEYGFLFADNDDNVYDGDAMRGNYVPLEQQQMYSMHDGQHAHAIDHGENAYLMILCSFAVMICCFCGFVMCLLGGVFGWMCKKKKYDLMFGFEETERNDDDDDDV